MVARLDFTPSLVLLLVGVATACGARSNLDASGSGGAPVGPTTAATTSTSSGVTSGASSSAGGAACAVAVTPPIGITPPGLGNQAPLLIARPYDDGATIAFGYAPLDPPDPVAPAIYAATFEPWGPWPTTDLAASHKESNDGGVSFAIARGTSLPLALAFQELPTPPGGLAYIDAFDDAEGPAPYPVAPGNVRVRFLSTGGISALGYEHATGVAPFSLDAFLVKQIPEQPVFQGPIHLGCATTPTPADAAPSNGAFIVALANGAALGDPSCTPLGPASELQIARLGPAGELTAGAVVGQPLPPGDESFAIGDVHVAASDDGGAWIVWYGSMLVGEDAPPPALYLTHVGADLGVGGVETFTVSGNVGGFGGDIPVHTGFAIGTAGPNIVLAWENVPATGADLPPEILVEVLDPMGHELSVTKVPGLGSAGPEPTLSLLVSPVGDAAIVAWSEDTGDAKSPTLGHVVRVCLP